MPFFSQSPTYNLKAVLNETGLTADVLRVWERRYGLPKPRRTSGGHRLYSEYDIETVKWLKARQAEGLSISRAVILWKEIIESGRDPLGGLSPADTAAVMGSLPAANGYIESLRRGWLDACLAFNGRKAEEVLNQAFAMYPVETVCHVILQHGLSSLGSDWYLDKVSVQQEHFASAQAVRRLETLITATPRPTRQQTVLLGCPAGEWHTFPVLLLNLLLRRSGLDIVYLGADIPLEQLQETASAIHPNLIVLAAQQLTTAASLRAVAVAFIGHQIPLSYGGLIFNRIPWLRERIPAYFLGESLDEGIQTVERLVVNPNTLPNPPYVEDSLQNLARLYREKRPVIEIELAEMQQKWGMGVQYLAEANRYFGNELVAALELGDPAFLEADLEWVKHLLAGRWIPANHLNQYLAAYSQVIRKQLGTAAQLVSDWIESYIKQHEYANS